MHSGLFAQWLRVQVLGPGPVTNLNLQCQGDYVTRWWFQPIGKMLVKMNISPQIGVKKNTVNETTTSVRLTSLSAVAISLFLHHH